MLPLSVETQNSSRKLRQHLSHFFLREHERNACVSQHQIQSRTWIVGIERDVSAAGFENAEDSDDHLQRPFDANTDQRFRDYTACSQEMRELVRALIEFTVSQAFVVKDNGHRFRCLLNLGLE